MSARLQFLRVSPLTTVQDEHGRIGQLKYGISAAGAMDRKAFADAGRLAGSVDGAGIEFTSSGLAVAVRTGTATIGWAGGQFSVSVNGTVRAWPGRAELVAGDVLEITPGLAGNFGYLRFGGALDIAEVMGSVATSTRAQIGGLSGRAFVVGDEIGISGQGAAPTMLEPRDSDEGAIRFIWGIHAPLFSRSVRERFVAAGFQVSAAMDRMGVRLLDRAAVFAGQSILSLVSEPVLPGDVQILGDGTPIVLMRDHQPTGGYPRIATIISADLDRFAQLRPGTKVEFSPVTVEHAQALLRSARL